MLQLYILRHAQAKSSSAVGDFGRELTAAGRIQAAKAAEHFAEVLSAAEHPLDAVLASSATRTKQTADVLAQVIDAPVSYSQEMYLATESDLRLLIESLDDKCRSVLLVGHNAGVSDLVSYLSGTHCGLGTAGVAHLDCPAESWSISMSSRLWQLQRAWHPSHGD